METNVEIIGSTLIIQGGVIHNKTVDPNTGQPVLIALNEGEQERVKNYIKWGVLKTRIKPVLNCFSCGLSGHKYKLCPQKRCKTCKSPLHVTDLCPVARLKHTCQNCGVYGHKAYACPEAIEIYQKCQGCDRYGHEWKSCKMIVDRKWRELPADPKSNSYGRIKEKKKYPSK
jgi:hypothetical protein